MIYLSHRILSSITKQMLTRLNSIHFRLQIRFFGVVLVPFILHIYHGIIRVKSIIFSFQLPWSNAFWPGLTPFGPLLWQVKQTVSTLCQLQPATQVGQKALALAKRRYSTVHFTVRQGFSKYLLLFAQKRKRMEESITEVSEVYPTASEHNMSDRQQLCLKGSNVSI